MPATAFDTLKATKALIAAGVDPRQAEAHAETLRDAVTEGAVTKADIAELKSDIAALETRMVKFGFGLAFTIVAANTALIVGLLRAFGGGD